MKHAGTTWHAARYAACCLLPSMCTPPQASVACWLTAAIPSRKASAVPLRWRHKSLAGCAARNVARPASGQVSEMVEGKRVEVEEVVKEGDQVYVKVIDIDEAGKIGGHPLAFLKISGACRRRTPRAGAGLQVPKDASYRDPFDAALGPVVAPRRSLSACSGFALTRMLGFERGCARRMAFDLAGLVAHSDWLLLRWDWVRVV